MLGAGQAALLEPLVHAASEAYAVLHLLSFVRLRGDATWQLAALLAVVGAVGGPFHWTILAPSAWWAAQKVTPVALHPYLTQLWHQGLLAGQGPPRTFTAPCVPPCASLSWRGAAPRRGSCQHGRPAPQILARTAPLCLHSAPLACLGLNSVYPQQNMRHRPSCRPCPQTHTLAFRRCVAMPWEPGTSAPSSVGGDCSARGVAEPAWREGWLPDIGGTTRQAYLAAVEEL